MYLFCSPENSGPVLPPLVAMINMCALPVAEEGITTRRHIAGRVPHSEGNLSSRAHVTQLTGYSAALRCQLDRDLQPPQPAACAFPLHQFWPQRRCPPVAGLLLVTPLPAGSELTHSRLHVMQRR